MNITKESFGTLEGKEIYKFLLKNSSGMEVGIINLGGIIVSINVQDKDGKFDDVVLGHDTLEEYLKSNVYFGAIVGRHANRIEEAKFELNGMEYNLAKNNGENHIHGGLKGFDKAIWNWDITKNGEKEVLSLTYRSVHMEENYPGNLHVNVKYSLTEENDLEVNYFAVSDEDTVVNLTNHSYFNLAGHGSGNASEHKIMINGEKFTPVNCQGIPTGEIYDVKNTQMDLREMKKIGVGLDSDDKNILLGNGYDHNWVLNVSGKVPEKAAELYDPNSGRKMEVFTTKPGVQFYTGNFLDNTIVGKGNTKYSERGGVCLETQYFPNSLKHKHFPSPILKKSEKYQHTTIFKFS